MASSIAVRLLEAGFGRSIWLDLGSTAARGSEFDRDERAVHMQSTGSRCLEAALSFDRASYHKAPIGDPTLLDTSLEQALRQAVNLDILVFMKPQFTKSPDCHPEFDHCRFILPMTLPFVPYKIERTMQNCPQGEVARLPWLHEPPPSAMWLATRLRAAIQDVGLWPRAPTSCASCETPEGTAKLLRAIETNAECYRHFAMPDLPSADALTKSLLRLSSGQFGSSLLPSAGLQAASHIDSSVAKSGVAVDLPATRRYFPASLRISALKRTAKKSLEKITSLSQSARDALSLSAVQVFPPFAQGELVMSGRAASRRQSLSPVPMQWLPDADPPQRLDMTFRSRRTAGVLLPDAVDGKRAGAVVALDGGARGSDTPPEAGSAPPVPELPPRTRASMSEDSVGLALLSLFIGPNPPPTEASRSLADLCQALFSTSNGANCETNDAVPVELPLDASVIWSLRRDGLH